MLIHRENFKRYRLKYRLLLITAAVFLTPTIIFTFVLTDLYATAQIKDLAASSQDLLERNAAQIEQNVLTCLSMAQSLELNQTLSEETERFMDEGREISAIELLDFKQTEVTANERMVNNNPVVCQTRIFLNSDHIFEIVPMIYQKSRAEKLPWHAGHPETASAWYFDYTDNLFSTESWHNETHTVSFVTPYRGFGDAQIGLLEVVSHMDLLFPLLYQNGPEQWSGYLSCEGELYQAPESPWSPDQEVLRQLFAVPPEGSQYVVRKTAQGECIFCYRPLGVLSGGVVLVTRPAGTLRAVRHTQLLLIVGISLLGALFLVLINKSISMVLKRFYSVIDSIENIQDLHAEIQEDSKDEIGLLASSVRNMTERIRLLVLESLEKERQIRGSELRALQNQINAHFINNILESIKMMAEIREEYDISDAVASLGRMLRYNMRQSSPQVCLSSELDYIQNYIALMRLRSEQDILLRLDIPDSFADLQIPKLSLQPVIENAIIHGMDGLTSDMTITITGQRRLIAGKPSFSLAVADTGVGMDERALKELSETLGSPTGKSGQKHGIGLINVQERIRLFYGENYGLWVSAQKPRGVCVTLTFPLA